MQIKRNYHEPFFRGRRKRAGFSLTWLLLLVLIGVGAFSLMQPETVRSTAYQMLGQGPTPTPLPSSLASNAMSLARTGNIAGAVEIMESVIEQRPDNIDYLYEMGEMLLDKDPAEPDRAYELAEQISDIAPNDVRGLALKARAMVWQDQAAAAIPIGLAGLQLDPSFAPLYSTLSRAYTNKQDWRQGLDYGVLATEIAPNDVKSWWAYAHALRTVGSFDESISALQRAIEVNPSFMPPYFELAFLLLSLDRNQEAIDTYDRILGMQPRNARALLRQCEAYRKIGEFQRALGLCQDSVNEDPTFVPAQYRLGIFLYNDRQFEPAQTAFQACVDYDPGNLDCNFRLGLTHYYLARRAVQSCEQDSNSPECTSDAYMNGCDTAWTMLNDSLLRAQSIGESADYAVEIIREGLTAVSRDPACPQYSGFAPEPEETPEVTPELTPEVTDEPVADV